MSRPSIGVLAASLLLAAVLLLRFWPRTTVECEKGKLRNLIQDSTLTQNDTRYSLKLEAEIAAKGKATASLLPNQVQSLSEAAQLQQLSRDWITRTYNACATSGEELRQYQQKYENLDRLALLIRDLVANGRSGGKSELNKLIDQYLRESRALRVADR